jgi:hypothetical protein
MWSNFCHSFYRVKGRYHLTRLDLPENGIYGKGLQRTPNKNVFDYLEFLLGL